MNTIIHVQFEGHEVAVLASEITNRCHTMYHITMESGYTNIFYIDVETGKWMEEDLGFTNLAAQIGNQINGLKLKPLHIPKFLTWHKFIVNSKPVSFGFFNYMHGNHKMFEIYHSNKKYMFTLVEESQDNWQVFAENETAVATLDATIIEEMVKVLPFYAYS